MPEQKPFTINDYLKMGLRRKWYIIIPFVLSIISSFIVYKHLPKVYRASTLILVQAQKVPESYVKPTLTESVTDRLNTISQEILSRTRLEKVINEFNLYEVTSSKSSMEEIVGIMRKNIEVNVLQQKNAFSISFDGKDPKTVMMVTNKLASMFIEENLKIREGRVEETADFISKELQEIEVNLKKKESEVRLFREKYMGQLPQQLDANLRIIERLQTQMKTTSENLRAAEDRIISLQSQIDQLWDRESQSGASLTTQPGQGNPNQEDPLVTRLNNLKNDLTNAESKYTKSHPDVVDLKRKIAILEPEVEKLHKKQEEEKEKRLRELGGRQAGTVVATTSTALDLTTERQITQYKSQLVQAQLETKRFKEEMIELKEQIELYQRRVEETPKREQEMVQINRDYELLKANYQSLVDKRNQSQMAKNLERKQQGEQFIILDPAILPEKPFKPNRNNTLIIGALIGLGIGLGLAWFRESIDKSFYEVTDLETYLGLPVLAAIPNLNEEKIAA